jgi:hypothetical protein
METPVLTLAGTGRCTDQDGSLWAVVPLGSGDFKPSSEEIDRMKNQGQIAPSQGAAVSFGAEEILESVCRNSEATSAITTRVGLTLQSKMRPRDAQLRHVLLRTRKS